MIDPNNKKNSANEASNETQLKQSMIAYSDEEANTCDNTYKSICSNTNFQKNSAQHCKCISSIKFVLDSGATQHMVNDERYFDKLKDIDKVNISAKKNESLTAKQQGNIMVKTLYKGDLSTKTMKNVLYLKDLKCNLMFEA